MAENTINDFNTLPEQVQINKEDIKTNTTNIATNTEKIATNTSDITKLQDDISKIKPNAWEERKFKIDWGEGAFIDSITYNPITDINTPLNSQKTFTDKDTYSVKEESINSYSYSLSFTIQQLGNIFTYVVCADPSCSISDLLEQSDITKKGIFLQKITGSDDGAFDGCNLYIYCTDLKADKIKIEDGYIEHISNGDDSTDTGTILSASVINYNYLRKAQASEIYLTKTEASNTYATKTELRNANQRINALDIGSFDVRLTIAGLAKIKADVTIGTPITLTKDTDFSESLDYTDYKTVLFTLYTNKNEVAFISTDIKLDVGDTADVYGDNDQNYTWLTGIGVIKLGPDTFGNNYLCYISYSQGYTSPLVITPIQKLS